MIHGYHRKSGANICLASTSKKVPMNIPVWQQAMAHVSLVICDMIHNVPTQRQLRSRFYR